MTETSNRPKVAPVRGRLLVSGQAAAATTRAPGAPPLLISRGQGYGKVRGNSRCLDFCVGLLSSNLLSGAYYIRILIIAQKQKPNIGIPMPFEPFIGTPTHCTRERAFWMSFWLASARWYLSIVLAQRCQVHVSVPTQV